MADVGGATRVNFRKDFLLGEQPALRGRDDSLVQALLEKLPAPGTAWPAAERAAWHALMANAFDMLYGAADAVRATPDLSGQSRLKSGRFPIRRPAAKPKAKAGKPPARPKKLEPAFYIDKQSFVRRRGGDRVLASHISGYIVDLRGINGALETIVWADDTVGPPKGVSLDITISDATEG